MKSQLEGVKKTLADTRRATQIEFLCFRKEKDKSSKSSIAGSSVTAAASQNADEPASGKAREEGRERKRRQGPTGSKIDVPIRSADTRI